MELKISDWTGSWESFEAYIDSSDCFMEKAWAEANEACQRVPAMKAMFGGDVKSFWQRACDTVTEENKVRLGGWQIDAPEKEGAVFVIDWKDVSQNSLGRYSYGVSEVIEKGLEGKENFLFFAPDAPQSWPFRYLLAMAPMPSKEARHSGGLLSHLHFQFASRRELLLKDEKLVRPGWYATMCANEGGSLDRCNIVRALHRLPRWEELPES